jgi:hypothetical protein
MQENCRENEEKRRKKANIIVTEYVTNYFSERRN